MKKLKETSILVCVIMLCATLTARAEMPVDTVKTELRSYVARNFSRARTFNLYWETSPAHNYTLKQDGNKYEKGKMRYEHTVKFATTIPLLQKNKFSLYVHANANFYAFETERNSDGLASSMFKNNNDNYNYFKSGINGIYFFNVFNKPLVLNATFSGDGWSGGFGKVEGSLSAMVILKRTASTNITVGMYGTTLFDLVPAVPIVIFTHQFNSNWNVDITLPSRAYVRYLLKNNHRISIGSSLEREHFYYKPDIAGLPKSVLYSKTGLKVEAVYEYIISERFYLLTRVGEIGRAHV